MSAACLSLHFRGGDCEARAPWDSQWVLFCDSGECRLQPLQTSEPGESLRTASRGAGAGRAGAGRPRPHSAGRAPGSTSHYPAPLASPDRPPPGQGGPRGGMEAALRAPQARGASESPVRPTSHQPGPPASPDGSPCRPTARAHPPSGGAEGAAQHGGGWRTRSPWRRGCTEAAGARGRHGDALPYGGPWAPNRAEGAWGRCCACARARVWAERLAEPAARTLLYSAVGDTDGDGAFPTVGTRAPRPRASCCGREGAAGSRRSHAREGSLSRWSPRRSLLFTSPPAAGRRPSSCGHTMAAPAADISPTPSSQGDKGAPRPPASGTVPKIRLEWLRTPRPDTRREMKPMRVCLGAGPPSLRSARLVPVPVRRRATRGDAIKGADLCSRGAAGRGLRKLPRPCLTLQPQVCGAGSQEGKVEPERGPASPSWNSRGGTRHLGVLQKLAPMSGNCTHFWPGSWRSKRMT